MCSFSDNAISVTWSIFQTRPPEEGINRELSGSPSILRFDRNNCVLWVRLEADGISCQITCESRAGFPKPINPLVFKIEGSRDRPEIVGKDGGERTPEQAFDYLMNWFYNASQASAQEGRI